MNRYLSTIFAILLGAVVAGPLGWLALFVATRLGWREGENHLGPTYWALKIGLTFLAFALGGVLAGMAIRLGRGRLRGGISGFLGCLILGALVAPKAQWLTSVLEGVGLVAWSVIAGILGGHWGQTWRQTYKR